MSAAETSIQWTIMFLWHRKKLLEDLDVFLTSRRVSIWTIKKGIENLNSLTISSCEKKKWHIYTNGMKYKTHYIIFSILILLHCAKVQSPPSPLHSHTLSTILYCHGTIEWISHASYTQDKMKLKSATTFSLSAFFITDGPATNSMLCDGW